ncbi:hypothetical protein BJ742DRAFT_824422 [Cladochytrium replicatum]|nr:hypothetical protein BJ742DRAFT_824422 [Cladochytrium replicatum]
MASVTPWSSEFSLSFGLEYIETQITVTAAQDLVSFSESLNVVAGAPTLYIVDPNEFAKWSSTVDINYAPSNYYAKTGSGDENTNIHFPTPGVYNLFVFCGALTTTVSNIPTVLTQTCSGTIKAQWSHSTSAPVSSSSSSFEPVISPAVLTGIIIGASILGVLLCSFPIVWLFRRRLNLQNDSVGGAAHPYVPIGSFPHAAPMMYEPQTQQVQQDAGMVYGGGVVGQQQPLYGYGYGPSEPEWSLSVSFAQHQQHQQLLQGLNQTSPADSNAP